MGQEISSSEFSAADFEAFKLRLGRETELLEAQLRDGGFAGDAKVAGFELEAWLVDRHWLPAPLNDVFLERVATDWVSPELSRFNVELNVDPQELRGSALSRLHDRLAETWNHCCAVAAGLDADLIMIGILPSLVESELTLSNMSRMKRYRALNEQVFRLRQGRPLQLDIHGREHLRTLHHDVMLEAATTSFQLHLQVAPEQAMRYYNASLIASAATVAVSANAPFLFGMDLWDETRIPLFEQAVEVGGIAGAGQGPLRRVSFGSGYARASLAECFRENLEHFPVLLPMLMDEPQAQFAHLRLHNGTIWRWNRPLVGFDDRGRPHLRIEHRVMAGGPTVLDMIANSAFYYGLVHYLAGLKAPPERTLDFSTSRDNFYEAARLGLEARIGWFDGARMGLRSLILDQLLSLARVGLQSLEIDAADIHAFLGIVEARVRSGQNGAAWQRRYAAAHGRDMEALTAAYAERQHSGRPVHEWGV